MNTRTILRKRADGGLEHVTVAERPVTVAEAVAAVNAVCERFKDPNEEREVVRVREYLTPDGKVVTAKVVRVPDGKGDATGAANERPGRQYAEPKPYFETANDGGGASSGVEDDLVRAKARLKELDALIENPATDVASRISAKIERSQVLETIERITAALKTQDRVGPAPTAGHSEARQYAPVRPYFDDPRVDDTKRAELEARLVAIETELANPATLPGQRIRLQEEQAQIERVLGKASGEDATR